MLLRWSPSTAICAAAEAGRLHRCSLLLSAKCKRAYAVCAEHGGGDNLDDDPAAEDAMSAARPGKAFEARVSRINEAIDIGGNQCHNDRTAMQGPPHSEDVKRLLT